MLNWVWAVSSEQSQPSGNKASDEIAEAKGQSPWHPHSGPPSSASTLAARANVLDVRNVHRCLPQS